MKKKGGWGGGGGENSMISNTGGKISFLKTYFKKINKILKWRIRDAFGKK